MSSNSAPITTPWWRHAVVYQVYPRSFADSNGDGVGDINGIRSKISYLARLGVDAIWINPWYRSPLLDGGYDVADYREIEPRYGTMADAEALIHKAHDHNIRVIADLVPNHTSWEHKWFVQAKTAPIGSAARLRYHIRPGRGDKGAEPPTNWKSVFGGPAWTRLEDGEWYLHLFDVSQPDLNWENPEVVAEFEDVFRFWLDRGIDGFRVDVAHGVVKDMTFPDLEEETGEILSGSKNRGHPFWDQDGVHDIIRGWRLVIDEYADRMMVAEAWVPDADRLARYLRPDEYHQSFDFDFLEAEWDAATWKSLVEEALSSSAAVGSAPTWVLSNHDVMRHPTRYGLPSDTNWRRWLLDGPHDALDVPLGAARAAAATMFVLALPGSTYLYQGEELGLPEVWDLPEEVLDDPVWEQSGHKSKGRDGCRVPIPWTRAGESFGFSSGPGWLPSPHYFADLSAEAQEGDDASSLNLYRRALATRIGLFTADESLAWDDDTPDGVVGFTRGSGARCWINLGNASASLPDGVTVILSSDRNDVKGALAPDSSIWFQS